MATAGWGERVGQAIGIWVQVAAQRLLLVQGARVVASYPCSTAARGLGCREGSYQTPTGWHAVASRHGRGLPTGAVLRSRRWTGDVHSPGDPTDADLILTRILRLRGLEPGHNAGGDVDTYRRYIYIHGTNADDQLGTPASQGCVRLASRDVMDLFDHVAVDCPVLIGPG